MPNELVCNINGAAGPAGEPLDPLVAHELAVSITAHAPTQHVLARLVDVTPSRIAQAVNSGELIPFVFAAKLKLEAELARHGPLSTQPELGSPQQNFEATMARFGMNKGMLAIGQSDPRQYVHPVLNGMWRFLMLSVKWDFSIDPIAVFVEPAQVALASQHYLDAKGVSARISKLSDSDRSAIFLHRT